jgi:hypothetical protein
MKARGRVPGSVANVFVNLNNVLLKDYTNEKYYPGLSCAGAVDKAEVRGGLSAARSDSASTFQKQRQI